MRIPPRIRRISLDKRVAPSGFFSDSPITSIWRYNENEKERKEGWAYLHPIIRLRRMDKAMVLALMGKHGMKREEKA
jgi:hypothetical protein